MLQLKEIKKDYPAGDGVVHALKGIDLTFRRNEFVSILGPSGCGKTTLLNIIGGLDGYTSGDLVINGRSTKAFKDRDWDTYRNHSIGFVFQSYNLIPHQSVLSNVELALTLSGVSKAERRRRAKKALEDVGLGSQLSKKPSEMSGGQMQRVAIARALVNNPEVILADEPTGALDTETSIQVMEILKEISKDRLIIMVTHNPELAEKYSTRIVRMLDGEIKDDTNPLDIAAENRERELDRDERIEKMKKGKKDKKSSMSIFTSFALSLNNLFTKKGRTILTSFAGSIGIIGIALILSISTGLSAYIDRVQEETLTAYPLTIESKSMDLSAIMSTFLGRGNSDHDHPKDKVYVNDSLYNIVDAMSNIEVTENDLKSFKKYLEDEYKKDGSDINTALNGISYSYNINMPIYTKNVDGEILLSDVQALMSDIYVQNMGLSSSAASEVLNASGSNPMFRLAGNGMRMWQELLPGLNGESVNDVLKKQYDVVYGEWPNDYNEVVLVLNKYNELDDITLYALGLVEKEHIDAITKSAMDNEGNKAERLTKTWTYEEICSQTYRLVLPSSCYVYDEEKQVYTDLRETDTGLNFLYDNAVPLKVTGIIRPNEDANSNMLSGSIAYTSKLTEYVIEENGKSSAIKDQLADENVDIFNGFTFKSATEGYTDDEKAAKTDEYINGLTDETKLMLYTRLMSIPSDEELANMTKQGMEGLDRKAMEGLLKEAMTSQMGMSESQVEEYLSSMSDEDMTSYTEKVISEKAKADYAAGVMARFQAMSPVELKAGADAYFDGLSLEEKAKIFEEVIELSDSTLEENLEKLGYVFLDDPATVNIYANSFENKDKIEDAIASYNEGREELEKIEYTDYVGLIMSSVTTIVNAITYVLIAFVAISLVVSSIMIGVITLISVQERTKEIGILRALGASKKNVSSLFNAETVIIGFASGLIGVGITILLCFPINVVIHNLTGIESLNAYLPPLAGVILVGISVFLTLISGIIPSRSAAKKDPVVALRTE